MGTSMGDQYLMGTKVLERAVKPDTVQAEGVYIKTH